MDVFCNLQLNFDDSWLKICIFLVFIFKAHALQNHPKSAVLFHNFKEDIECDVLIKQEESVSLQFYIFFFLRTSGEMNRVQVNPCQKLFFLQNMGRICCVQKLFWMSGAISVHNMFFPGLSLEFSCIELVIQWTICRHIVG